MKKMLFLLLLSAAANSAEVVVGTFNEFTFRPGGAQPPANLLDPAKGNEALNIFNVDYSSSSTLADFYISSGVSYYADTHWSQLSNGPVHEDDVSEYVNEAYLQKKISDWNFSLGRKKVRWGVAYVLSPTDLISRGASPRDPENDAYSLKGSDLLGGSYAVSESSLFDIYYLPKVRNNQKFLQDSAVAFRWYNYVEPFDISMVGRVEGSARNSLGINSAVAIGDALELHAEILWQSENYQQYPDLNYGFIRREGSVKSALVGGQWSPSSQWNLVLEYLHISNGYSSSDWDTLNNLPFDVLVAQSDIGVDAIQPLAGQITKRKNYTFFRAFGRDLFANVDIELIDFVDLDDGSNINRISLKRRIFSSGEIFVRYGFIGGNTDSEFGQAVYANDVYSAGLKFKF